MKTFNKTRFLLLAISAFVLMLVCPAYSLNANAATSYDLNAENTGNTGYYPGVFWATAEKNGASAQNTLGIPEISKDNLTEIPTQTSPAIICGAATPYEKRTGFTDFTVITNINGVQGRDGELYPPYSNFRYEVVKEKNANYSNQYQEVREVLAGFDGTYYIIRLDVSELIAQVGTEDLAASYLHVKQKGNLALTAIMPKDQYVVENFDDSTFKKGSFADLLGNQTVSYSLADSCSSLKDSEGYDKENPYVDIILVSSGACVDNIYSEKYSDVAADFKLMMYIDKTADYDPSLTDYPAEYKEDSGVNEKFLNKYFDDDIFNDAGTDITSSYLVKGSDLEIEIQALSPAWFWSLKKALTHTTTYDDGETRVPSFTGDDAPIKLISEIRSRDKMTLEGAERDATIMIIDLNGISLSFENNDPAGEAGISVEKATLRIKDELAETVYSNNLGSKLSLGNNSSIRVGDRGRLCIKENTRLDVDYYTRSTTISENSAAQAAEPLESGAVTIEDGGEIINDGVITIKGKEEKVTGSSGAERVFVNAEFYICEGGKLTNNGCLLTSGKLYNMGTITNFGSYSDIIKADSSKDGDYFNYKGIQIVCKDDMTQTDMESMKGDFTNGMSPSGETNPEALIDNYGDILISPGRLDNYGYILNNDEEGLREKNLLEATTFDERKACIYLIAVNQALCPDLDPYDPTVKKKYIYFGTPVQSYLSNETGSTISNNGIISPAKIIHETCINDTSIYSNKERFATVYKRYLDQYGSDPNEWTDEDRLCYEASLISNSGAIENTGSGSLIANELQNTGYLLNGYDSGGIDADIILSKGSDNNCVLTDSANVLTRVYNGGCKKSNNVNEWTYVPCTSFEVTPIVQDLKLYNDSEKTERSLAEWTVTAHADETQDLTDVQFLIDISYPATVLDKTNDISHKTAAVQAETPTKISGLPAPKYEGRMICDLCVNDDAVDMSKSTVINVTDSPEMFISTPIASELIYDGTEQPLFSQDEMDFLQLECSICTSDESAEEQVWSDWSREVFKKKDAGDYKVRFRKTDSPDCVSEAVTYTIDRRIAIIDVNDFTVKTGTAKDDVSSKIQVTTFGMVEGDTLNTSDLSFYLSQPSTDLPYMYIYIRGTVEEELEEKYSNYDFEILRGTVNYTENDYTMTARSKSREYSDASYNECYIEVNVPDSAKVYYSAVYQLDESNYNTCGREIPEYASHKAGRHMMYYYIYDESQGVRISASKNYYILKSPQKSISADTLNTKATSFVNSRDGLITGLTPRSNEYHRAGIPYETAYCEEVEVYPGQYYVRSTGDANHYPGPVTVLTVEEGPYITANYISKEEKIKSETDLIYGSLLSPPELPEIDDHDYFLGWFSAGEPADFTRPVTKPIDFEAMWETRYTVTFDISLEDYPYTIPESQIVKAGNTVSKPDVPEVDGYRMTGWTCDGVSWDFSNPVNKDITLIAQYERIEPDTIQIDFDLNGLEGTVPARQFIKIGGLITKPEDPVVEDYEFICWTYENSPWNFTTPVYNDMTLVARFIYSKASASCNQGS
ncbi:MAG: InlB B-repeat-containing protein, partial [Lachnospiraceae bacterium]|nr:InlB B-repeat-containing protein [Lachnospiraceae bacterium]